MDLSLWVAGTEYSLDDGTYCWHITHDGVGMIPVHRLRQRGPMQHGATDLGFRGDPRIIQLVLLIKGTSKSNLWTMRTNLLNLFKPGDDPLKLQFTLDNDLVRQIECYYVGDMTMGLQDRMGWTQRVGIILDAADPTFFDPIGKAITFGLGGGEGGTPVPTDVPTVVGTDILDQTRTIVYDGSWLAYPYRIRILGPIVNPVITNLATDEVLDFTGITIGSEEYHDIDCRFGYKTITDQDGTNKIADLTEDSDLVAWHLEAHPEAPDGHNDIRVEGSSVTAATEVYIQWFDKFVGI